MQFDHAVSRVDRGPLLSSATVKAHAARWPSTWFHAAWRPGLLGFEIINDPGNSTTAGAGVEWAFADNWTAKVEYLYVNLGNGTVNCATEACLAVAGAPIPVSVGLTGNLVRAGVNFKFSF